MHTVKAIALHLLGPVSVPAHLPLDVLSAPVSRFSSPEHIDLASALALKLTYEQCGEFYCV